LVRQAAAGAWETSRAWGSSRLPNFFASDVDSPWSGSSLQRGGSAEDGRGARFATSKGDIMIATAPVVAFYAGILGLLAAALTLNVILNRVRSGVESCDGGVPALMQALRAHGNFVEQAPIALILVAGAEAAGARVVIVHGLGVVLLVARFASAVALGRSIRQSPLRQFSGGLTDLLLLAASVAILLALAGVR
jgi:uncharacterized protein